ncbi:hypothetical protein ACN2C7_13200 [Caulobacter sp. ErkDOM-E]|uniref:hypothetical protein n=1 Tax=Caulobacter sp. ErkDOM-E TaxID=3402778 RepID=UPI003AF7B430
MPVNVVSYNPPTGNIAPTLNNGKFNATFGTTAVFGGAPCSNGEYRQYVRGRFVVNGSQLTHYLCVGDPMSTIAYKEDGCLATCTAYGHRTCPADPIDSYTPAQATGCNFSMSDAPGFNNVSAAGVYLLDLYFQGDLIDTSTPSAPPMRSATWTVNGTTTVTATTTSSLPPAQGLQSDDRIIEAHFARNLLSQALEVHVVVARAKDAPPLDPALVNIALKADDDVVINADVAVHEVASKFGATASIVHTLDPNAPPPTKVHLGSDPHAPGLAIGGHP